MKPVTIRQLAEACGVSISTASKALNRSERISEATARRIEEKARELGYVGSHAARSLAAKPRTVAVCLPEGSPDAERYREGCRLAEARLAAAGITLVLCAPEDAGAADAVLLHPSQAPLLSVAAGVPVAVFGGRAPALHPVHEVMADYRIGGRLSAQFLAFATGGAPTAVITARRGAYGEEEGVRGFRELSAKLGISVLSVLECGDNPRRVQTEVRRLLSSLPRIRGLFVTAPLAGAVAAAALEGRKKPLIVAADFTPPAQDALRAGSVAALLYPSPERQVEAGLLALSEALRRPPCRTATFVRQELVLKSNLESYL